MNRIGRPFPKLERRPGELAQLGGVGPNRRRKRVGEPEIPDIFAQFNAWTDPNIGGTQPGTIQPGYGGFQGLDTMGQVKLNDYLNTLAVGGPREQAMNQLGYFNSGNPFTPQVPTGYNRNLRAQGNAGGLTPGIYQYQANAPTMNGTAMDLNSVGGYTGIMDVGETGTGQYLPFDINYQGGQQPRPRRRRAY
jgi:hypothetical protein